MTLFRLSDEIYPHSILTYAGLHSWLSRSWFWYIFTLRFVWIEHFVIEWSEYFDDILSWEYRVGEIITYTQNELPSVSYNIDSWTKLMPHTWSVNRCPSEIVMFTSNVGVPCDPCSINIWSMVFDCQKVLKFCPFRSFRSCVLVSGWASSGTALSHW